MFASAGEDLLRAVLQGAPPGTVYALVALGFVLAYKTSGVFNLAFGAQAYVSAVVFFKTRVEWEWGVVPSFLLSVVVLAPLLGVLLEFLVFRHLRTRPPVSGLVVAIGLTLALPAIVDVVLGYEPRGGQTPEGLADRGNSVFYEVLGVYSFSRNELVAMAFATAAVLFLAAVFKFSAIGLQMRAVVESPRMTELNGIDANKVSAASWALSSFFAGLAGVLIAPRFSTLASGEFLNIVVIAIAAAAIGSLVSLPRAFAGGVGLGVLIAVFTTFVPKWATDLTWLQPIQDNVTPAIPFIVLFGVLVFVPSIRRAHRVSDPLSGVDPPPTSQARIAEDPTKLAIRRVIGLLVFIGAIATVYTRADTVWTFLVTQAVVLAIVFLSISVITGFAGHISLAQGAFAAAGAFAMFQLADRYDVNVLAGALVGALLAAALGALLSLLILRLNGIWIAIATLAFAFFFHSVIVKFPWAGGTQDGSANQRVPRPTLGPWDLSDNRAFLVFAAVVLAIVTVAVSLFGRSDTGRMLRALRGSETASQSIGISPARGRVIAFAVSAGVAALGGAFVAMHQQSVAYDKNFAPLGALFWLVLVVTFGVRRPMAALLGAASFSLFHKIILEGELFGWLLRSEERIPGFLPVDPKWMMILFGLGTIQYAKHPEGVIDMTRAKNADKRAKRAAKKAARADRTAAPAAPEPARDDVEEPVG